MVSKTMHHLREDLQNIKFHFGSDKENSSGGSSDRKGPGGGGGGGSSNRRKDSSARVNINNPPPTISENVVATADPSSGFGFGVGGMGMTQEEKNNLRRCQDELEDYSRKFKDVYEKFGNLEGKIFQLIFRKNREYEPSHLYDPNRVELQIGQGAVRSGSGVQIGQG